MHHTSISSTLCLLSWLSTSMALPTIQKAVTIGYMWAQTGRQNACQLEADQYPNQIGLPADVFQPSMCGLPISVTANGHTINGVVIERLEAAGRLMVSPNMFTQFATLDEGIVQGSFLLGATSSSSISVPPLSPSIECSSPSTYSMDMPTGVAALMQQPFKFSPSSTPVVASTLSTPSTNVLLQNPPGTVDATLYYSADGRGGKCGPPNGISSFAESGGYAACEPNSGYQTLMQRGSNNVVAIPLNILSQPGMKEKLCGKKIVVTVDGKERDDLDLAVWDGCQKCSENGGLDFSSDMFAELFGQENCGQGRIKNRMTWKILDEKVVDW